MMEDKNIPEDLTDELSEEILAEVDRAAAETVTEFADLITEAGPGVDINDLPPELLEKLQREKAKSVGGGTKSMVPRAVRNKRRKAQRKARKITRQTGGGRTTSKRTRAA